MWFCWLVWFILKLPAFIFSLWFMWYVWIRVHLKIELQLKIWVSQFFILFLSHSTKNVSELCTWIICTTRAWFLQHRAEHWTPPPPVHLESCISISVLPGCILIVCLGIETGHKFLMFIILKVIDSVAQYTLSTLHHTGSISNNPFTIIEIILKCIKYYLNYFIYILIKNNIKISKIILKEIKYSLRLLHSIVKL